ncbi:MAG TPA: DUF2298 domain-containing protein [Thermoanaerobaculaceae bacterium]|nr:DUF2298 domain-containing protein [Thermoanaerobaculaceae bacterium]HRS14647.1 DUF2298 domain-containing protein [Thermoanaerobaculaceae bacterium]
MSALDPSTRLPPWQRRWALAALLALALGVRVFGVNWDQGANFHPDERRIAEAAAGMSFKPLQLNPHFFAYGSFPLYVTRAVCSLAALVDPWWGGYDGAIRAGRLLGAVWGTLSVLLVFLLGRRLFDRATGLLAASLLAVCVLPVQNAHFATNDIPLSTLVLLALHLAVRAAEGGRLGDVVAAGVVGGLALATKVSAAPLALPLGLAAVLRWAPCRAWGRMLGWGAAAGAALAAGFCLGQPYALLDHRAFLHDVLEQSAMVRNAGLYPYTNQYVGVPKVAYDLRELVVWGMGPALGLTALAGLALAVVRGARERRAGELLLLAWVVPFAAVTMSFDVKFPRYLLPVYPLLVLWGAAALQRWGRVARLGRWVRAGVVTASAAYLLAFMAIYVRPHTVRAASEWYYAHVPPGSRVLSQDWDEGFPQHLPGRRPETATVVINFPFYEPDGPGKVARLAQEVAVADFIALQTKRLYGATTQAHARFPLTSNFFYLLFAGDLGYDILVDFTSRPRLFGLELPSELADESFSVYDHPKVLIFRNQARLPAEEIERRIRGAVASRPISRAQMLTARADAPVTGAAPAVKNGWLATLLLAGLLEALGLAGWALLASGLGTARQGVYALGKPVGVLLVGLGSWWLVAAGWLPLARTTVLAAAAAVMLAGGLAWRRFRPRPAVREVMVSEVVVWGCFAAFLGLRLLNPEIYWGEKPMDFSFLNALYRTSTLPPPEPWFSGSALHYTYFGHFLVAALGKALAIAPEIMFNLGIALTALLLAAAALAAGAFLGGRLRWGVWAVGLCVLAGNLAGPGELWRRRVVNFDYFWATSRVIPNTINEVPAWNLVFADLHAHVLAMPWALTLIALLALALAASRPGRPQRAALLALGAAALGAIMITNGWSTPTYLAAVAWVALVAWWGEAPERGVAAWLAAAARRWLLPVAVVSAGALLLTQPFWHNFSPPPRSWGREVGPYAHPWKVLLIFGLPWLIAVPSGFGAWWRARMAARPLGWRVAAAGMLAVAAAAAVLMAPGLVPGREAASRSVALLAAILLAVLLAGMRDASPASRLPLALAAMAVGLVLGCEFVFVWDRMNTIFKFYLDAWLLVTVAAAGLLPRVFAAGGWGGRMWRLAVGAACTVAAFTAVTGAWGAVTGRHTAGPRCTLDGMAYLEHRAPHEKAAFDWLNRSVKGLPVVVEAFGPSYQEYARVSMNTGLPTVLGWEYHVFQRSQSRTAIEQRKRDIELVYTSPSPLLVADALARHHVGLVFVGRLERQTYRGANLGNFRTWNDLLVLLYENPEVSIFGVRDNLPGTFPLTAREAGRDETGEPQALPGYWREPRGVACDRVGNAVVADFGHHRIQVVAPDSTAVAVWGRKGTAPGELTEPTDVAVGPDGSIFVADTWNARVQVFDPEGVALREWSGDFYGPRGIAVGRDGSVWVADTGNHRIVHFTSDGRQLGSWGEHGNAPGALFEPMGLAVDAAGHLVVCDSGNGRVQVFRPDGTLLTLFAVPGWRREVFSEPHVAVDAAGLLWVTVPLAGEIRAYSPQGQLRQTIQTASLVPPVAIPIGIAFDPVHGQLVVTDIENRLVRFPWPRPAGDRRSARLS